MTSKLTISGIIVMIALCMLVAGCGQNDRLSVQWIGDDKVAVVTVVTANNEDKVYKLVCHENKLKNLPFDYAWEDDCDLNTVFKGRVQDWDNPEDDRFENERLGDNKKVELGGMAIGAIVGNTLANKSSKLKKTTVAKKSTPKGRRVSTATTRKQK